MKRVDLIEKKIQPTTQIFQQMAILFAYVTEKEGVFNQIHFAVRCRDFLTDPLWSRQFGQGCDVFGFAYDFANTPYDLDALKLSLKFPDEDAKIKFISNLNFIHTKEKQAKITKKTKLYETYKKDTLIIIADKKWQSAPWKISLYSYYLKCMAFPDADPRKALFAPVELMYKNHLEASGKEDTLLKNIKNKEEGLFHNKVMDNHNYSGFVSLIRDRINSHPYSFIFKDKVQESKQEVKIESTNAFSF